ncbi:hypothetical protein GW17_00004181 [Ensete ventricosum]|nr:hypothetical protein GW17_00004181 [Ensete ventricosum]
MRAMTGSLGGRKPDEQPAKVNPGLKRCKAGRNWLFKRGRKGVLRSKGVCEFVELRFHPYFPGHPFLQEGLSIVPPMELKSGAALMTQQYAALLRKNFILTWRHKKSAFLQLFSSLFFIFLIFCIDKAVKSRFSSTTAYNNVHDPQPLILPPIPPCEDKFYVKTPCHDFIWSGNASARIATIVSAIRKNNPGREIPAEKVSSRYHYF